MNGITLHKKLCLHNFIRQPSMMSRNKLSQAKDFRQLVEQESHWPN